MNLLLLTFVLTACAIGASLNESEDFAMNSALDNVTNTINNISLSETNDTYANGIIKITEAYMKLVGNAAMEVMRMGILFGKDNPEYFEPSFIIKIIKLLVWLAIISLLVKPVFYLIVLVVMGFIFIKDHVKNRKNKKEKTE